MKHPLVPGGSSGELTTKSFSTATTFVDLLLDEGYVILLSREEDLYIVDYIWSERGADRNDVVFMDRCDFEMDFYETEEEDEEDDLDYYKQQRAIRDAENSAWRVAQKFFSKFPAQVDEIFGLKELSEEERGRFWAMYPDQLTLSEVRERLDKWERKQMADTEEEVMKEAMKRWDIMNDEEARERTDG